MTIPPRIKPRSIVDEYRWFMHFDHLSPEVTKEAGISIDICTDTKKLPVGYTKRVILKSEMFQPTTIFFDRKRNFHVERSVTSALGTYTEWRSYIRRRHGEGYNLNARTYIYREEAETLVASFSERVTKEFIRQYILNSQPTG